MKFTTEIISLLEKFPIIKLKGKTSFSLTQQGKQGVYYIKKGIVRVYKKCKEDYFMSWIGFEGDLLGLDSVFSGDYHLYHYEVAEDCEVHFISKEEFSKLLLSKQMLMADVMHYMSEKSDMIEAQIANIHSQNVNSNFIKLLYDFSNRRIHKIIPDVVSTNDIANMIGTTKNYVYKMIQKLENQLIVSFRNRQLIIINKELLKKAMQQEK